MTRSDIRAGLYPHPPNLAQEDTRDATRAFWIIKHGIGRIGACAGKTCPRCDAHDTFFLARGAV
jgi:hypothetical protein